MNQWCNCPLSDRRMNHWMKCSERDKPGHCRLSLLQAQPENPKPTWPSVILGYSPWLTDQASNTWASLSLCMADLQLQYKLVSTHFKTPKKDGSKGKYNREIKELYWSTPSAGKQCSLAPYHAHTTQQQDFSQLKCKTLPKKHENPGPHLTLSQEHHAGSSGSKLRQSIIENKATWLLRTEDACWLWQCLLNLVT